MYDLFYRHFLAVLFTSILAFMFWGGYVAGSNGWPWMWFAMIPIYGFVFARFKG